jgi:hypothetical protein
MAKCERRVVKTDPPPVEYVLTLSADEAAYLRWRLNTDGTKRKEYPASGFDAYAANRAIWKVLADAGVERV